MKSEWSDLMLFQKIRKASDTEEALEFIKQLTGEVDGPSAEVAYAERFGRVHKMIAGITYSMQFVVTDGPPSTTDIVKKGFKLVHDFIDGHLRSVWSPSAIDYHVGSWVVPERDCGPLGVFPLDRKAEMLSLYGTVTRVNGFIPAAFYCEYVEAPAVRPVFWDLGDGISGGVKGTAFASKVKLVKEIWPSTIRKWGDWLSQWEQGVLEPDSDGYKEIFDSIDYF